MNGKNIPVDFYVMYLQEGDGWLFFRANQIAYIRTLAGKHFPVKILFPVNVCYTVFQFFNRYP